MEPPIRQLLLKHSEAISAYEKKVADHTALQTWTSILSLFATVATTAVLIWITWNQTKAAERQVALDYALAAPNFSIDVDYIDYLGDARVQMSFFPERLELINDGANVGLRSAEIIHQVDVFNPDGARVCALNLRGMHFIGRSSHNSQFRGDPELFIGPADVRRLEFRAVVLAITYEDVFGELRHETVEALRSPLEHASSTGRTSGDVQFGSDGGWRIVTDNDGCGGLFSRTGLSPTSRAGGVS